MAPNKGAGRREGEDAALVQGRCWWLVTGAGPGTPPWWHGCSPNHCTLGPATCPRRAQHPPELSQPWPRTAQPHQHQPGATRKPHTKLNKAANLSRPQFCPHHSVSHSGDDFFCIMLHATPPSWALFVTVRVPVPHMSGHCPSVLAPPGPLVDPQASRRAPGTMGICAAVAFP